MVYLTLTAGSKGYGCGAEAVGGGQIFEQPIPLRGVIKWDLFWGTANKQQMLR